MLRKHGKNKIFEMTKRIDIYKKWFPTLLYTNVRIGGDKELPECWEKEIKDRFKPNCSIWTDYLRGEGKSGSDFITASLPDSDNVLGSYTNSEMWDQILQWKQLCTWGRQNISNLSWTCMLKSLMNILKKKHRNLKWHYFVERSDILLQLKWRCIYISHTLQ